MYIVTGGAGLIGSAMIWKLNQENIDDILVVDHIGLTEKWKNLAPLKFSNYIEKGEFYTKLLAGEYDNENIAGVFHFGACSATTEKDGSYLMENNFRYTRNLAEFCIRKGVKMLYASSCATYGNGENGYEDNEEEIEKLRPLNMYGYSKQLFDLYAKKNNWFKYICGCKFSNIYGPNELHKADMRSVICRAYEQITESGNLKLFKSYKKEYANGEQLRDFLYVKDAVNMVWFLFCHKDGRGLFNIGSGKAESWNALANACFKALNKAVDITYIDMPETLKGKYQYYTKAEMGKLYSLGYKVDIYSLEDAIKDYICNYLERGYFLGDK